MIDISNIRTNETGEVVAQVGKETRVMNPAFLLMQVLANKRIGLTAQYVDYIQDMNNTNKDADELRALMAILRANKTEGNMSAKDFNRLVVDKMKEKYPNFDMKKFHYEKYFDGGTGDSEYYGHSYYADGHISKDKYSDMIEDIRNKITSLNNLNSQTQIKVKMTEMYRNETIEWQNGLVDKLGRVFEKINQA